MKCPYCLILDMDMHLHFIGDHMLPIHKCLRCGYIVYDIGGISTANELKELIDILDQLIKENDE